MTSSCYWLIQLSATPWTSLFRIVLVLTGILIIGFFLLSAYSIFKKGKIWRKRIDALLTLPVFIVLFFSVILMSNCAKGYTLLTNTQLNVIPESNRIGIGPFPYSLTKEQWLADIQYLKEKLPLHHANPFLYITKREFDEAVATLVQNINSLTDQEIGWEVCRIVSMIRDGHTQAISVPFNRPPFQDSRLFPLRVFRFEDGWYVTEADKENAQLTGLKMVSIDGYAMDDVMEEVSPYVPGENKFYKMQWAFPYLLNASLLKYRKIIASEEEAAFTFVNSKGEKVHQRLKPVLTSVYFPWFRSTRHLDDLSRLNKLNQSYWYEYDPAKKSVFVQINQAASQDGHPTLKQFSAEVDSLINNNAVERLIVDLRNCNGGDNSKLRPLIKLVQNPKINQSGKLLVLIGRQTFSGGVSLTAAIERNSKAIFIGEPAGSGPNQCGDTQRLTLPNSKLIINVSGRYHQQSYVNDKRLEIAPRVPISYSYANWFARVDPARVIAEQYTGSSKSRQKADLKLQTAIVGRYKFDEEKIAEIKVEGDALWMEVTDFNSFARVELHTSGKMFKSDIDHVYVKPGSIAKGSASTILLGWAGRTDTLAKLPVEYKSPAELLMQGSYDEAIAAYRNGRQRFHFSSFTEEAINALAYELSAKGEDETAHKLFVLNSELFPASGNVWDSLAESYLNLNKNREAKASCEHALELNPENETAKNMLKKIQ